MELNSETVTISASSISFQHFLTTLSLYTDFVLFLGSKKVTLCLFFPLSQNLLSVI